MPYEIAFTAKVDVTDPEGYINDCCWGGDVISDRLLPAVSARFSDIQANQEDWGWFIWIREDSLMLAIDIYCDDKKTGAFRIHLCSRKRKWLAFHSYADAPEIEWIKEIVTTEIRRWGSGLKVAKFSSDFMRELDQE